MLATTFFGYFKLILLTNIEKNLNYFEYIDDIFISNKTNYNVNALFDLISNLHPSLKFTREVYGFLSLLDVFVQETPTSLNTSIYGKPTFDVSKFLKVLFFHLTKKI